MSLFAEHSWRGQIEATLFDIQHLSHRRRTIYLRPRSCRFVRSKVMIRRKTSGREIAQAPRGCAVAN